MTKPHGKRRARIDAARGARAHGDGKGAASADARPMAALDARAREAHADRLESIAHLATTIAKDFGDALATIRSFGESARGKSRDPAVRRELDEMLEATERASQLARRILSIATTAGETHEAEPAPEAATSSGRAAPASAPRVLFVDDEELITQLAGGMLGEVGYAVRAFTNSRDALAAFASMPDAFDAVVMDMVMPGLTGEDLARRLRALRPDVPIVLCTGFSERLTPELGRELGIDAFVLKPFNDSKLLRAIREVLERRRSGQFAPGVPHTY